MTQIGIICGLKSEAATVRAAFSDARISIGVSGANAARAESLATQFCAEGVTRIISVGVSGGLLPAYEPGDLVIGSGIVTASGETFACDPRGLELLRRSHKAVGISPSVIYGSDAVIVTTNEKQEIFQRTGAKSVDMESHGAARAAEAAKVSFLAIRAIADPASRTLPSAALDAVNSDGSTKVFSTLINAAKDPAQFPALMQLGQDSKIALESLRRNLGGLLGVLLLGSDLG